MWKKLILLLMIGLLAGVLYAAKEKKHTVDAKGCIGCTLCVQSCPTKAITMQGKKAVIDPEKCVNCGLCVPKCPTKAIHPPKTEKKK